VAGQPQAEESRRRRHRTEDDGTRKARLEQAGLAGSPGHDVVDLECHADAEQQRQGDDVCEIELQSDHDADFERYDAGQQERQERHEDIAEPPQCDPKHDRN
jgi:hypothetical protein